MSDEIYDLLVKLVEPVLEKLRQGKTLSAADRDYLMMHVLSREYREGTDKIAARIENAEQHIAARIENAEQHIAKRFGGLEKATSALQKDLAKYAAGTEKLIQGLLLAGYEVKRGKKNS